MPESTQYMFKHKELAEILVKEQGIHEGLWKLSVKFGFGAASMGADETNRLPTAIVPVMEIGIEKATKLDNLTVDASQVNPQKRSAGKKRSVR